MKDSLCHELVDDIASEFVYRCNMSSASTIFGTHSPFSFLDMSKFELVSVASAASRCKTSLEGLAEAAA
jgi:hypothetical protein